jgi:site-specific DNA recombinase
MSAQAALEGRFLGGRPPYGYRIADAGPHPNPAKAADGKRLHKLEPDPDTAGLVGRIFAEYLAGRGLSAIAEGLTRDRIPSPSQQDRARNRHRTGEGWSKSAVRTILCNPRYTGRQVWNKQRKDGSSWTSMTSPQAMRPGCAGTRAAAGSGPTPSSTSP